MKLRTRYLVGTMLAGAAALVAPAAFASSHREAPAISGMPRVDSTDFYMFRSYEPGRAGFVTLIANYLPLQAPYGGPNYFTLDHNAVYEINVDTDGDAVGDLTFQFRFKTALKNNTGIALNVGGQNVAIPLRIGGGIGTQPGDANINETESYTVTVVRGDRRKGTARLAGRAGNPSNTTFLKPIDNIGKKTLPNYNLYASKHIYGINIPGCNTPGSKVFVGQRAEAFAVNLGEVFDLVNLVPIQGKPNGLYPQYNVAQPFPGGITQNRANDDLIGKANVTSLALEVPIACLKGSGNGVIGAWTTASLPQAQLLDPLPAYNATAKQGGALTQVSRLSAPLVNELVIGLKDKDLFSAAAPTQDGALAGYVTNPTLPALLNLLFKDAVNATLGTKFTNIAPTKFPRADLVAAFLTGFPGVNQQKTVTPSEMMRLNMAIPATPRYKQNVFGLVAEDLAGFPNGRRPADDVTDLALRVVMGALCYPLPLATELGIPGAKEDTPSDFANLGYCNPRDAVVGNAAFTDGAPTRAIELQNVFPYLNNPIPGSPNN